MSSEWNLKCAICDGIHGNLHQVQENMFGFKDTFNYFECQKCGALQLTDPPKDMSFYYPSDKYYSLQYTSAGFSISRKPKLTRWLSSQRNKAQIFNHSKLASLLVRIRPLPLLDGLKSLVGDITAGSFDSKILDVGCGHGNLLNQLASAGFTQLTGIDPYLPEDENKANGVHLRKCTLNQLHNKTYDLIMFNHSLEHMENQILTLSATRNVLAPNGVCRIEIPISGCEAWNEYGTNWVEIDAPRHFCLHTIASMRLTAENAGLSIFKIDYAGSSLQFWGSELYKMNISLHDPVTNKIRDPLTVFTLDQMAVFEERTAKSNAAGTGGRAIFYLQHG